jgi:hypothetical protein
MSDIDQFTEPEQGLMRGRNGRIIDRTRAYDSVDTPFELTYGHAAVHRDIIVNATHVQSAGTGDLLFFFKTPADPHRQVHLEYLVTAGGDCEARWYRAPAVATQGTMITRTRLFDGSTKGIGAEVYVGGTVTGSNFGVLRKQQYNGGGGAGGNIRGGAAVHDDAEWVLALDTWYCLRLTRTASQKVSVEFEWYEVPEIKL